MKLKTLKTIAAACVIAGIGMSTASADILDCSGQVKLVADLEELK